ncbi:MAG TPA: hypothetical protein VK582_12230 [Pyrinomonadaceae bacterium]|nr:hypothetical protein [Pyrinomonadaceae bacterium]
MDFNIGATEIPDELRNQCRDLFNQFEELSNPDRLRHFVSIVVELTLVTRCVPKSGELVYDELIAKLLVTRRSPLNPALFDLLDALARRYKGENRADTCNQLKEKIREVLLNSEKPEKDYQQQLVAISSQTNAGGGEEEATRWIDEAGDDLDERALRITLAVFHGTTFETIERAKDELLETFQELVPPPPPPAPDAPAPTPPAPHVPLMQRLKRAGAYETEGEAPDWKKVVVLKKPELAGEALVHIWQIYRETKWRQKLIEWLTNCVSRRAADARTRAAVAAGILAIKDYRFVRENLLDLWVESDDGKFRTAIGMALGVLVREGAWEAEVQNLLRTWSDSPDQAKRWAALRAYIYVGAYCKPVSEVIARWRAIADSEYAAVLIQVSEEKALKLNNPMHMSLMDAMVRFFVSVAQLSEEKKRPLFAGILDGLKKWVADAKADAGLGLFMFTTLGRLVVGGDGESDAAPVLLQLVSDELTEDGAGYRSHLAGIFELIMRNGVTIKEARDLLCDWLGWVDGLKENSPSYESRIRRLFEEIIAADTSGRMRGKLRVCLRDCGRKQVVERILSEL